MTKLEAPLRRLVEIAGGEEIVLEIFPADEGIGAHLKLRRPGARKSYFTMYLQPPSAVPVPGPEAKVTGPAIVRRVP